MVDSLKTMAVSATGLGVTWIEGFLSQLEFWLG